MTVKSLATAVAAVAAIGAAAAGVASIAAVDASAPQVRPVVFGVPLPLDPADDVPSAGELLGVLNGLQAPGSFAGKGGLIEGGIGPIEAQLADIQFQQAMATGQLPLSFNVTNVQAAGPGAATADVTASGRRLSPTTRNVTFVDQDGWKLSRGSAMTLLREAGVGI